MFYYSDRDSKTQANSEVLFFPGSIKHHKSTWKMGLLTVGAGAVSKSFDGFGGTFFSSELPCQALICEDVFSIILTCYAMFV